MNRRGILDTGPLVAFLTRSEHFHAWTVQTLARFESPLDTCDAVISEAWFLLGRTKLGRQALVSVLQSGAVRASSNLSVGGPATLKLMTKYADQPMSIADACLVRMAEMDKEATLITLDRDFTVYRRGRSPLKLAAPFVHS